MLNYVAHDQGIEISVRNWREIEPVNIHLPELAHACEVLFVVVVVPCLVNPVVFTIGQPVGGARRAVVARADVQEPEGSRAEMTDEDLPARGNEYASSPGANCSA